MKYEATKQIFDVFTHSLINVCVLVLLGYMYKRLRAWHTPLILVVLVL